MVINFKIKGFSDALHLEDNHEFSDAEVEAMKQARYDKWFAFINTPPSEETPVVEE